MLNITLGIAFLIFLALVTYYVMEILRFRRGAKKTYEDIQWNLDQLRRAMVMINSKDEDEIFAGLELLFAINHPARLGALSRLSELTSSQDVRIARQARKIIDIMGRTASRQPQKESRLVKTA
jgi:hypothetical protein